jgi:multidrug resistance protein, MATE family
MNYRPLTKFKEGSLGELWKISFPLMISSLAWLFMIFVDRCFLAQYSQDALNAATSSGTLSWALLGSFGMLTATGEIFVAQYYGAKKYEKIGSPVWQMIYLSLLSFLVFIPLGIWGKDIFFSTSKLSSLQSQYFAMLMFFAPFYPMLCGIAGFNVGRGKTKLLLYLALAANIINIFLDWILIFGYKSIPSMGIQGAAIATSIGSMFQATILFILFLKKKNREKYNTTNYKFDFALIKRIVKIGFPSSLFYAFEIIGWTIFYIMMTMISDIHITIASICQSLIILFSFFMNGLYKGVSSISGNFIGSNRLHLIKKTYKSALLLQTFFAIFIAFFFIIHPMLIVDYLLIGNNNFENLSIILPTLKKCLFLSYIYVIFEGLRWIYAGLLTAAGDTFFLLISGAFSVWIFLLLPVYLIVVKYTQPVEIAYVIGACFSISLSLIFSYRFHKGKWQKINLIQKPSYQEIEK